MPEAYIRWKEIALKRMESLLDQGYRLEGILLVRRESNGNMHACTLSEDGKVSMHNATDVTEVRA